MASDLPPTTKLLLHTVGSFMDRNGRNARVQVSEIAKQSSLSRCSILTHLRIAYDAGWLLINMDDLHVGKGAGRKYDAKIPPDMGLPAVPISSRLGLPAVPKA